MNIRFRGGDITDIQSVSKVMNYLLSPAFHPSFFVYTFPYLLGDNRVFSCVLGQIVLLTRDI